MKKLLYSTLIFLTTLSSCHFLDDYSQDLVVVKSVTDLDELLLGDVYMDSKKSIVNLSYGDYGWFMLVLDDDINGVVYEGGGGPTHDGFANELIRYAYYGFTTWQMQVERPYDGGNLNSILDLYWNDLYRRINICNVILDEIEKLHIENDNERIAGLRVRAEAHFMRAYFYFQLNNLFADMYSPDSASVILGVPMKTTSYVEHDKDKTSQFDRTPLNKVYEQIISDLKASIAYFDESPQIHSYYRTSGMAARLLLGRVYLYMQNWAEARKVTGELLEMRPIMRSYLGLAHGDIVITRDNPEILFSTGSLHAQNFVVGKIGDFCVAEDLYKLYRENDARKDIFFSRTIGTDSLTTNGKYDQHYHQSYVSDLNIIRTSEAYLNMAEACVMDNDPAEAMKWLNEFCYYRYSDYEEPSYDTRTLVNEIRLERRKEFCFEGGHRWFDLRRYAVNKKYPYSRAIERVFPVYNGSVQLTHIEIYRLEEHDQAYTFLLPRKVREFDTGMPDNRERPDRKAIEIINPSDEY